MFLTSKVLQFRCRMTIRPPSGSHRMTDFDRELFAVVPPAFGLVVLGLLGLIAPRMQLAWRVGSTGLVVTGIYGLLNVWSLSNTASVYPWSSLLTTAGILLVLRTRIVSRLIGQLQRPTVSATAFLVAGLLTLAAIHVRYDAKYDEDAQRDTDQITRVGPLRDRVEVEDARATTDRGRPIPLSRAVGARPSSEIEILERQGFESLNLIQRAIRRQPGGDDCNCHGWVFTGGRYIVSNDSVAQILEDNGYARAAIASPGDLVIYRSAAGEIIHTAIVRYVAPGRVPMVEGKWGWMGVYLHAVNASAYGKNYAFYRANRDGDVLRGIDGSTAPVRFTGAE